MIKYTTVIILIVTVISCRGGASRINDFVMCDLPSGWAISAPDVFRNDRIPWWNTNPVVLQGDQIKRYEEFDPSIKDAVSIKAIMYNHNDSIAVFIMSTYSDADVANKKYEEAKREMDPTRGIMALSNKHTQTYVYMGYERINDKDKKIFLKNFYSLIARD